jgi:hypothetical protein
VSDWEAAGRSEVTARWCSLFPALSTDPEDDLTGLENDYERVKAVLDRYRSELQRLVPTGAGTGITGLCVWSPVSRDDRPDLTSADDFRLSVGVPSGLSPWTDPAVAPAALDCALSVAVPDESQLPQGPLFLEGVPLVVGIIRPGSLRPLKGGGLAGEIHEASGP